MFLRLTYHRRVLTYHKESSIDLSPESSIDLSPESAVSRIICGNEIQLSSGINVCFINLKLNDSTLFINVTL